MNKHNEKIVLTIQVFVLLVCIPFVIGWSIPTLILKYLPVWCIFVYIGSMGLLVLYNISHSDTTLRQK